MPEYRSKAEKAFSYHRYILDHNTPYEALNFLAGDDGLFRGYVPVGGDADEKFRKINTGRLGGAMGADRVEGVVVIFCAPDQNEGGLRIVGFYRNATVLKKPEISDLPDRTRVTRVISEDAVLIPEADRVFTIPGRHDGGFGQASLWYGLNEGHPLRGDVLRYVEDTTALPPTQASVIEYRHRRAHERWEGRGATRGLIHQMGFCCEACDYAISSKDQPIWGSGFELHHLTPWAEMQEGGERELTADDFAVLCATCHRAIHRSGHVSDVMAFRTQVLAKRGV